MCDADRVGHILWRKEIIEGLIKNLAIYQIFNFLYILNPTDFQSSLVKKGVENHIENYPFGTKIDYFKHIYQLFNLKNGH